MPFISGSVGKLKIDPKSGIFGISHSKQFFHFDFWSKLSFLLGNHILRSHHRFLQSEWDWDRLYEAVSRGLRSRVQLGYQTGIQRNYRAIKDAIVIIKDKRVITYLRYFQIHKSDHFWCKTGKMTRSKSEWLIREICFGMKFLENSEKLTFSMKISIFTENWPFPDQKWLYLIKNDYFQGQKWPFWGENDPFNFCSVLLETE